MRVYREFPAREWIQVTGVTLYPDGAQMDAEAALLVCETQCGQRIGYYLRFLTNSVGQEFASPDNLRPPFTRGLLGTYSVEGRTVLVSNTGHALDVKVRGENPATKRRETVVVARVDYATVKRESRT